MPSHTIEATCGRYYTEPPQQLSHGEQRWITRSANVVVVVSQVHAGTELQRDDNPDEYMLLLPPGARAQVQSREQTVQIAGDSLVILPPGFTRIRILDDATVTRIFTNRATDLCALAANAEVYAAGAPAVAPLVDWPMPIDGYRIRSYALGDYCDPRLFGRLFRSRGLMINVFERKNEPRDPGKLSPHSHDDFEQISLALDGTFVHHLRTPWGADAAAWREDMHVELHSPSTIVIPAKTIHTTQAVGFATNWLVDIFGPPREDFSRQQGLVRNADEYPLPAGIAG